MRRISTLAIALLAGATSLQAQTVATLKVLHYKVRTLFTLTILILGKM